MSFLSTKKMTIIELALCFIILIFTIPSAHAQSIPITFSPAMNEVVFDGKWTFYTEWKPTSLDTIEGGIPLRTAHLDDFIYILVDAVPDTSIDNDEDNAVVCFDAKNEKSSKPDSNDY